MSLATTPGDPQRSDRSDTTGPSEPLEVHRDIRIPGEPIHIARMHLMRFDRGTVVLFQESIGTGTPAIQGLLRAQGRYQLRDGLCLSFKRESHLNPIGQVGCPGLKATVLGAADERLSEHDALHPTSGHKEASHDLPIRLSGFSKELFPYRQTNDFGKAVPSNSAYDESVTCVRFDRITYGCQASSPLLSTVKAGGNVSVAQP